MKVSMNNAKDGLIIEIPTQEPEPSSTGKMMITASTHGFVATDLRDEQGSIVYANVTVGVRVPRK